MKILITVEFYYAPGGGGIAEQTRQIAEGLVKLGHQVLVATSVCPGRAEIIAGVTIKSFAVSGSSVKGITGDAKSYIEFLKSSDAEVLINFGADVWTTDLAFAASREIRAKKILSTPGLSKLGDASADHYYTGEYLAALQDYDRIVYTSANYRDKKFGDAHNLSAKAVIIPNGASAEEFLQEASLDFKKKYSITTPRFVMTVANHYFAKGHNFGISAFKKMKRRDTTLVIFGDRPARHAWYSCYLACKVKSLMHPRLKLIRQAPRAAVVAAYQQAEAFIFGSQLECAPLVMYESFAGKVPFITRQVGNVSDHADYVKIVETPEQMAAAVNTLIERGEERAALTGRAFSAWKGQYTWSAIASQYDALIRDLVSI